MLATRVRRGSFNEGEREARRAAAASVRNETAGPLEAVREESQPVPSHVEETLRSPGEPLDERLRTTLEPRFGHDFSRVRVHSDDRAASSARQLHARAYTFGHDVVFGQGRYNPNSLPGRTLVAHELAHVVQQGRAGHRSLQLDSELEQFPEAERRKVSVESASLDRMRQAIVDKLFRTPEPMPIPSTMTIQFGASVAPVAHDGLKSVAGFIATPFEGRTGSFLTRNTTLGLAVPAAGRIYRFTRFDRPSTAAAGSGVVPEVVFVEEIGAIPPKPITMAEIWDQTPQGRFGNPTVFEDPQAGPLRDCLEGASPELCHRGVIVGKRRLGDPDPLVELKKSPVTIRKVTFERGPGWWDRDWSAMVGVLEGLPDSVLKEIAGVKFLRQPIYVCKPDEPADECDPAFTTATTNPFTKTVTVFDAAFKESTTRFGMVTELARTLVHELGHIADFNPIEPALRESDAKMLAARTHSGSGWVKHPDPRGVRITYTELGGGAAKGSFREAAIQDGLVAENDNKKIVSGALNEHTKTSWRELYAESFSLYLNDPDLLKAIRPNVFKYLAKTYPR